MRDDDEQDARPASGEARDTRSLSLGESLTTARSAHSLSVEQLAAELRVDPAQLHALEDERFHELGPAVFIKGYLKLCAQRLGLDYAELLRRYEQAAGVEEMPIVHRSGTRWQDSRRGTRTVAIVVAILIGVSAWLLWTNRGFEESENGSTNDAVTGTQTIDMPVPQRVQPTGPASEAGQGAGATAAVPAETVTRDVAGPAASDALDESARAEIVRSPEAPDQPSANPSTAAALMPADTEGHTDIVLSLSGDSWVEISDANGDRVYYGLAEAGQTLTLAGRAPLSFLFGNASSVEMEVDGQPYPLPADDVIGNIARFTIASVDGSSSR